MHHDLSVTGDGKKVEKHLCSEHAMEDPEMTYYQPEAPPIHELLSTFVKMHSSGQVRDELACAHCGLTFAEFRERSLLGCPQCYASLESVLGPLLERAHEGGVRHLGKVPRRGGADDHRQIQLSRLRKRLDEAVTAEDYELAADLRDEIGQFERSGSV